MSLVFKGIIQASRLEGMLAGSDIKMDWRNGMRPETEEYKIFWPSSPIPGCLAVVGLPDDLLTINSLQQSKDKKNFVIRAVVSDHIPLAGGIRDSIERESKHLIDVDVNPLTIFLHHGHRSAVYFDLVPDEAKRLQYVAVEVESLDIFDAIKAGRTAINELLDSLIRRFWLPLVISRIDVHIQGREQPLAHQILFPFPTNLRIGLLGGLHQYPLFSELESLVREAAASSSPFYRFLCAYRLCEGIGPLRHQLKKAADKVGVTKKIPKDTPVDQQHLLQLGYREEIAREIKTVSNLCHKFTTHRNRVAHFLLDKKEKYPPLHLSDGYAYFDYSVVGAVLLYYGHQAVIELLKYFNENLEFALLRGSVLPMVSNRHQFRVIAQSASEANVPPRT